MNFWGQDLKGDLTVMGCSRFINIGLMLAFCMNDRKDWALEAIYKQGGGGYLDLNILDFLCVA